VPETRLYTKLSGTSAVTDLVGTRIGPIRMMQGAANPKIVYNRASTEPVNHSTGTCDVRFCTIHVDCYADTPLGARALSAAVRTALTGWTDAEGSPVISMSHQEDEFDSSAVIPGREDGPVTLTQTWLIQYVT